ncbi:hypothetical protein JNUCC1_01758 [Lentibacillus sp. JNUCC-1]|uniref:extracellular matrix regulator RemB n=1 Tax=Lentibacillus sp. JNUCC-1 TaxID=2654513 RepID=UPI00132113D2|nr:hypothetical protein [Lentibacillus sp. JNUCC-1]
MFIHIGGDNALRVSDIVSIINLDVVTSSTITQETVEAARQNKTLYGKPTNAKTIVVTTERIYYSSLSINTLKKRTGYGSVIEKLDDYTDYDEIDEA